MKKQSPKQSASETENRPAPVGNGETAQGAPSQAANPSGEIEREEYKKFERDIATVKAAFANALARSDACFLSHTPDLAETMASVVAFDLGLKEIRKGLYASPYMIGYFECDDNAWHLATCDMQIAVYEWLEKLDMPKGALSKFKTDIMKVYHHPSGYIDGYGEKLGAIDTLNEDEYKWGFNGREYVRTEYKSRDYFRRLVSIARMACAANDRNATAINRKPDAEQGTANPSGGAGVMNLYGDMIINTEKPIQVNAPAPAPAKQKPAGNVRGLSQAKFAALLIHYGGKCHGAPYTARAVKIWDRETDKRPTAGGLKYTPELRRDIMGARIWAKRFNEENENAYKARKARI